MLYAEDVEKRQTAMIISHKHRFIFIRTVKTTSTSIEIALSKYCGEDDIITPIGPDDEALRSHLGYRGPQNYYLGPAKYALADLYQLVRRRIALQYWNHADAAFISRYLGKAVWDSYYKFCFERNLAPDGHPLSEAESSSKQFH